MFLQFFYKNIKFSNLKINKNKEITKDTKNSLRRD